MTTQPTHTYRLGVLLGDGIGPEIVPSSVAMVDAAVAAAGVAPDRLARAPAGRLGHRRARRAHPRVHPQGARRPRRLAARPPRQRRLPRAVQSQLNPSGTIRKHFGLYANIRPAKSFPGGNAVVEGTDLVIARENTEGFYADRNTFRGTGEMMPTPDVAIMHGIITRAATERIAHSAFELAQRRRKQGHHRAQGQRAEDDHRPVPRRVPRGRPSSTPSVELDDFHIDAMTVHLVRRADKFDVIVTENMFGDILSDLAGEIAGSLGIAPSLNSSDTHAMAQAAHGSAPDIAGQDIANPIAMNLSSAMLLDWLGAKHDDPRLADAGAPASRTPSPRPWPAASRPGTSAAPPPRTEFTAAVVAAARSVRLSAERTRRP